MVSIITVNYNGWKDTCELIASLKRFEEYPYEIIVVDNASRGDDVKRIKAAYPDVMVIGSDKNLGFAGGNNLGYQYAKGDYIFFLNNDMVIENPVLETLVNCFKIETVAGVTPTIRYWRNKNNIQYHGCRKLNIVTLRYQPETFDDSDSERFLVSGETEVMHGGAMMVRRSVIEKVGKMTEVYFLFAEEFDWSYRILENGYKLWYDADTVIYHKGGATLNYGSPLRAYYMSRARLLFARRNSGSMGIRLLSCFYLSAISMPKNFCSVLLRRDWRCAMALLRGTWHGLVDKKN